MRKIVIALTALAGMVFMSGCAYDYYPNDLGHFAYGSYGYRTYYYAHPYYTQSRLGWSGWDCVHHFNTLYCGHV